MTKFLTNEELAEIMNKDQVCIDILELPQEEPRFSCLDYSLVIIAAGVLVATFYYLSLIY